MGKLDEIDMKILGSLHKDASVSIPKLSKDLGLNLSVTYSRIKRLSRRKIIKQFTIVVDEEKLGFPASAVVGVNLDPKQRDQALAEMSKLEQVRIIQEVTGRFDAFVTVRGKTIEEIYKIVAEGIGKVQGVNQAETFVRVETLRPEVNYKIAANSG
ncbi:MAG: Lrp/AsnC family transcriptional regulator [Nitrososphaerota archaeon]|jgi:Lrp/AsnC family transcriptional regulator for asnA, asnC and gidA|nr:Lrp/AsnC family transcriptional regulator [Nitrososphaerota archaeon]